MAFDPTHGGGWELLFSLALAKRHVLFGEEMGQRGLCGQEEWLGGLCIRQRWGLGGGEPQKGPVKGHQGAGLG